MFKFLEWKITQQANQKFLAMKVDLSKSIGTERTKYFTGTTLRATLKSIARREGYEGDLSMVQRAAQDYFGLRRSADSEQSTERKI